MEEQIFDMSPAEKQIETLGREFPSPSGLGLHSDAEERFLLLAHLQHIVDNPSFAVDFHEIEGLLLELGSLLRNCSLFEQDSPEIFEDPHQRSDCLGNVLMRRSVQHHSDQEIIEKIGDGLLDLVHQAAELYRKGRALDSKVTQVSAQIGDFDDTESESILAAKAKIVKLRRDNCRLESRNWRLYSRLESMRIQLKAARKLKASRSCQATSASGSKAQSPGIDVMSISMEESQDHPRKMTKTNSLESQTDCLRW